MIEIEEAAFISKIPTKITKPNHIAFIHAILAAPAWGQASKDRIRRIVHGRIRLPKIGGTLYRLLMSRRSGVIEGTCFCMSGRAEARPSVGSSVSTARGISAD